jgi:flagellar assembly protein FliH
MSSSSDRGRIRNVPPPPGSKAGNAYTRFIPREELQDFAAWAPDSFGGEQRLQPGMAAAEPATPAETDWAAEVAAARQAGYEDGYRDGLVALEGFKQSFAAQATAQVGALVQGMDAAFDALEAQLAEAVTATAVRVARQVLRHELSVQPEVVARVAGEAVSAVLLSARQIAVHVHPQDLPLVAEGAGELLQSRGARLVAEPTIQRGGCRIESDLGAVDARVESRWALAAGALGMHTPWDDTAADTDAEPRA